MTTQRYTGKIFSSSPSFVLNESPTATSDVSYLIQRWQEDVNDGTGDVVAGTPDATGTYESFGWSSNTVESSMGGSLYDISCAIVNGNPAVAYADGGFLNFAINANADGSGAWTLDDFGGGATVIAIGVSLAVVDGRPAIAYYNNAASDDLVFTINANADGSGAWTTTNVHTTGDIGRTPSLAIVDGKPAISYYDSTNGDLYFAINTLADSTGTWNTYLVDNGGTDDVGNTTSLAVVDGKPGISYYDVTNTNLKFAINANADGSGAWTTQTVDSTGNVGRRSSLVVLSGNPAIAYEDVDNNVVKFTRNANADGSGAWSTQTISGSSVSYMGNMKIVSGVPVIGYADTTHQYYTINSAADGSGTWTVSQILASPTINFNDIAVTGTNLVSFVNTTASGVSILFAYGDSSQTSFPYTFTSGGTVSLTDDYYNGWWIKITNDTPAGIQNEVRQISDYVGATRTPTFSSAWDAGDPVAGTTFSLYSSSFASLFWDESADRLIVAGQPRNDDTTVAPSTYLDLQADGLISTSLTTATIDNGASTTSGGTYTSTIANNAYTLDGSYNAAVASQSGSFSSGTTNCLTAASQAATTSNTVDECAIIASVTADIDGCTNAALIATNGSSFASASSYSAGIASYGDITSSTYSIMSGGTLGSINSITSSNQAICLGGISNAITTGTYSGILCGTSNTMQATSSRSVMLCGQTNVLQGSNSLLIGGSGLTLRGNYNTLIGSRTDSVELGVNGTTYNQVAIESIPLHIVKNSSASGTILASEIANGILTLVDSTSYTLDTTANLATKFGIVANTFVVSDTRPTFRVLGVLGAATETCDISLGTGQSWTNNSTSALDVTGSVELILTFTSTTTMDVTVVGSGGGGGSSDITTWSDFSFSVVSGFSSITNNKCQYQRIGNLVTIIYDISVTSNSTTTSATLSGLPLSISNFGAGNKIANSVWIFNSSDTLNLLGRAELDQTSPTNMVLQVNTFTNTKNYDITGQIQYTVNEASATYLWATWTPAASTGIGSLTNNASQYNVIGTYVSVISDLSITANATGSSVTITGLPYTVSFSGGTVSQILIVDNSTDATNFFARATLSGTSLVITGVSNFENTKNYDIKLQFSYPI